MNIFLGHTTACLFWLTATQEQYASMKISNCQPESLGATQLKEIPLALEGSPSLFQPFHVELPRAHHRVSVDGIRPHFHNPSPAKRYLQLSPGMFIASPELTFIQMAEVMTLHELTLLGTELCSNFLRSPFSSTGLESRDPLTTPKRLKKAVDQAGKFTGKSKADKALRFIQLGNKSPKEIETAIRFGLQRQYGGDGLPPFACNYHVDIPEAYKHLTDKPYIEIDFCWPKQKVAVEYDSDLHTGSEKIAKDTMRRNILVAQGYKVIGITRMQSNSRREMDRVAEEVAIALGARHDVRSQKHFAQKRELLETLDRWLRPSPEEFLRNSRFQ